MRVIATLRKLLADRQAATAVEYSLILALIFLGMVGAVATLGGGTSGMWSDVERQTTTAMTAD
jgi:pilus assembly protein Flp/PilA